MLFSQDELLGVRSFAKGIAQLVEGEMSRENTPTFHSDHMPGGCLKWFAHWSFGRESLGARQIDGIPL